MTDRVKELASDLVDDLHALSNFVPTDTFKILLAQRIAAALNEAERVGREGMREETIKELRTGNYCQRIDHIQDACQCDGMELAIRALPVPPPKPERGSR